MRIITIAGSHRGVGKTYLARLLKESFGPGSEIVKVGRGRDKGKPEKLLQKVEDLPPFVESLRRKGNTEYLIIESGAAGEHIRADLAVFIEGWQENGKPSMKADILIGGDFNSEAASDLLRRKGFNAKVQRALEVFLEGYGKKP